jgi:D-arabinose 1-dehydrogenase-like Zn-dependent alcohol dehydrogenase
MAVMRVAQVPRPKGLFEIVERQIPEPGAGTVRIKVHACGICHGDARPRLGVAVVPTVWRRVISRIAAVRRQPKW